MASQVVPPHSLNLESSLLEGRLGPETLAQNFSDFITLAASYLRQAGLAHPETPSAEALTRFSSLPRERQSGIITDLREFCELAAIRIRENQGLARDAEVKAFCRFLHHQGLRVPDQDFLDSISDGDLIEVYNSQCTQIYRSWAVFHLCSYSLAELSVYTFDELYERPSWVLSRLMELVPIALSPSLPLIDFQARGIPEYILRERLSGHGNTIYFKMKLCRGLLSESSGAPAAFVSTGKARAAAFDRQQNSLAFI